MIAGVNERDIDLLLLEELLSTPDFGRWLATTLLGDRADNWICTDVRRSLHEAEGESDLVVEFAAGDDGRVLVLIENKVGAGLQPRQAERYTGRGADRLARGTCNEFHTVIVAPAAYFSSTEQTKGFDHRLDYEELLAWFERAQILGARRRYKVAMLTAAIQKGTLGYQPVEDAPVTAFWQDYWRLALQVAPELEMRRPEAKPSRSGFIAFAPPGLRPLGTNIVHKVRRGYVDLHLRKLGDRISSVHAALGQLLDQDMTIERATGSAAVRVYVPLLSTRDSLAGQDEAARLGLSAARRLHAWCLTHERAIQSLCKSIAPAQREENCARAES